MIGRFDLDGRVFDPETVMEQTTCTIQHTVRVRSRVENDVGRGDVHARRQGPHVEIVDVRHTGSAHQRFTDLVDVDVVGSSLRQDAQGLAEQSVELAVDLLTGAELAKNDVVLEPSLRVRGTTAAPRA